MSSEGVIFRTTLKMCTKKAWHEYEWYHKLNSVT